MNQDNALGEDLVGSMLLGRYRIVRELAKGGMGVVYLARVEGAVGFVKPVVVKLILADYATDERFLGMFVREAQILSQLRHPGVVNVLEFGEQDGAYIMVLEYVRGHHLGQWSRYLKLKDRHVPTDITIQIVIDVLDALHHAHEQRHPDGTPMNIAHRDVSPSNILLDEDGRARLLDFGVARMHGGNFEYKTQVRGFVGKLPYIAPEILNDSEATPQSDLYACAVVLHETILGRNTFRGETQAATLHRVMSHVPDWVASAREDIPDELDEVLRKALAKKPEDRFATANDFANALRKLLPDSENAVRRRLAALLREDFNAEMATMLGIESLADRDEAWRRLSLHPPAAGSANEEVSSARLRRKTLDRDLQPPEIATVAITASGARSELSAAKASLTGTMPGGRLSAPQPIAEPVAAAALPVAPAAAAHSKLLMVGLIIVALLAIAAIVVSIQGRAPAATNAPAAPRFRVVAQGNEIREAAPQPVAPAPTAAPVAPPSPTPSIEAAAAAAAPATPDPIAADPATPNSAKPARGRSGPDAQSLTRAFRSQQPKIEACFRDHAVSLQGQPRMQVEFSLDAGGALVHVELMPASLAATPLGGCIERVARATKFPGQGEPVSFAIPVTASQGP